MSITVEGAAEIVARFDRIASDQTKKRLLMKLAQKVISSSKKRVRDQTDLNGNSWAPRTNQSRKRRKRMLLKIGRAIKQVNVNANEVAIGFANYRTEQIAAKQQFGFTQAFSAGQAARAAGALRATSRASTRQAAALLNAGFKIRSKRGGYKTPTKKWIIENMTEAQAGVMLRELGVEVKQNWNTVLPPRSFLGVPDAELPALTELALNEMKSAIGI